MISTILWVLVLAMVAALVAFITYAGLIGLLGVIMGDHLARCPRCHRHGFSVTGRIHDSGCPPGIHGRFTESVWKHLNHVHLQHH